MRAGLSKSSVVAHICAERYPIPVLFATCSKNLLLLATLLSLCCVFGCKRSKQPGQVELEAAAAMLDQSTGRRGFGANEDEREVAAEYAAKAKELDSRVFSGGIDRSDAKETGGEFLTYCKITGDTVVFIVRVPSLKNYRGSNHQRLLREVLWPASRVVSDVTQDREVVIVTRGSGSRSFGSIADGPGGGLSPGDSWVGPLSDASEAKLYGLFATGAR